MDAQALINTLTLHLAETTAERDEARHKLAELAPVVNDLRTRLAALEAEADAAETTDDTPEPADPIAPDAS